MQSSLVGNVQVNQSFEKEGYGKVDGRRQGDVLGHTISKGYTGNGSNFNEEAKGNVHLSFEEGSTSKNGGDSPRNIFYFKSRK
ncbi:hypothetical protein Hanom_Chr15g01396861 [Helianthus anomalus]